MRKQFKGRKREHRTSEIYKTQEEVVDLNSYISNYIKHKLANYCGWKTKIFQTRFCQFYALYKQYILNLWIQNDWR